MLMTSLSHWVTRFSKAKSKGIFFQLFVWLCMVPCSTRQKSVKAQGCHAAPVTVMTSSQGEYDGPEDQRIRAWCLWSPKHWGIIRIKPHPQHWFLPSLIGEGSQGGMCICLVKKEEPWVTRVLSPPPWASAQRESTQPGNITVYEIYIHRLLLKSSSTEAESRTPLDFKSPTHAYFHVISVSQEDSFSSVFLKGI